MTIKVYTRKGDKGLTSIKNKKVSKASDIIDIIGQIDNLQTSIGFIIVSTNFNKEFHQLIQKELFTISSVIAGYSLYINELFESVLEVQIDELTETLLPLENFIFAGDNIAECYTHKARVDCRSLERSIVRYIERCNRNNRVDADSIDIIKKDSFNKILKIINRLSDYLFTVCRCLNNNEVKIKIKTGDIF